MNKLKILTIGFVIFLSVGMIAGPASAGLSQGWADTLPVEYETETTTSVIVSPHYENDSSTVELEIHGNFSDYATLNEDTVSLEGAEETGGTRVNIDVDPSGLEVGDTVNGTITAYHVPDETDDGSTPAEWENEIDVQMEVFEQEQSGGSASFINLPLIGDVTALTLGISVIFLLFLIGAGIYYYRNYIASDKGQEEYLQL